MVESSEIDPEKLHAVASLCWPKATADELRELQKIWYSQPFQFTNEPGLGCFFEQHKNGPCGVLSSIQALMIQKMLYSPPRAPIDPRTASKSERDVAFAEIVANCLWKASEGRNATLLVAIERTMYGEGPADELPAQEFTRKHDILELNGDKEEDIQLLVKNNFSQFNQPHGVVLFLFSLILSRGLAQTLKDLSVSSDVVSLVYKDGCCEQAIVNFIIGGRACNEIDNDHWKGELLGVGFITTEPNYRPAICFTSPAFPVWVAHGGGHYTVLWSNDESVLQYGGDFSSELNGESLDDVANLLNNPIPPPAINETNLSDSSREIAVPARGEDLDKAILDSQATATQTEATENDEDQELARALALSLQQDDEDSPAAKRRKGAEEDICSPLSLQGRTVAEIDSHTSSQVQQVEQDTHVSGGDDELAKAIALSLEESPTSEVTPHNEVTEESVPSSSIPPSQTRDSPLNTLSEAASVVSGMNTFQEDEELQRVLAQSAAEVGVVADTSFEEEQLKRAIAESLLPVTPAASTLAHAPSPAFDFFHYNGLHPLYADEKPVRVAHFKSDLHGLLNMFSPAKSEIEDANQLRKAQAVLTHRVAEGGAQADETREFLIVCASDGSMEGRPELRGAGKWRCRDCHLLNPPNWRAYMDEHENICRVCHKSVDICGFCHWVQLEALPAALRRTFERENSAPIVQLLRRRWPSATIEPTSQALPALWG